nr:hypothetical protein MEP432_gp42 [Methylophilales phage MEP432]
MTRARDVSKLLSTSNGKIAGSNLDVSFENIEDTGTEGTRVATGTSAQRGSTAGQFRFNTDTNLAEYYDGTSFKPIDSPPTITSVSPTSFGESQLSSNQTVTISGGNFSDTVTVELVGNDGTSYSPASTTRNSVSQITITTPTTLTNANENYKLKVTNSSGLSAELANALSINATPVFSTAAGSLGTLLDTDRSASNLTNISFSDSDSTATLSVTSGSIPSGLTLASDGTFSGTANSVANNTTSTFTVTATDGSESATRQYSITVNAPVLLEYLVVAGGGGGGGQVGGGGGAGGMLTGSIAYPSAGYVYTASVGGGGSGQSSGGSGIDGTNGSNSSLSGSGLSVTSIGGGGGGGYQGQTTGKSGGSGGGGGNAGQSGGSGTSGQGNSGGSSWGSGNWAGGGGGGAGQSGTSASNNSASGTSGDGGDGLQSSITGTATYYAGGGGGCADTGATTGGQGGGGNGGYGTALSPQTGTGGLGGGAGGSRDNPSNPYRGVGGGSGVVIIRVPTAQYSGTTSGSPTVTTDGDFKVIKFTGNGSYTS